MKSWIALVGLLAAGAACADEPHLPVLSKNVRKVIRARMHGHGQEMSKLVWAVVFLDYAQAKKSAEALPKQPQLRKDLERDATDLDFTFPERFFDLLVQLNERAGQLAIAAGNHDGAAMATAYGSLSQTCVACHAVYLDEPAWKKR